MAEQFGEPPKAMVGLVERRVDAGNGPLQRRGPHVLVGTLHAGQCRDHQFLKRRGLGHRVVFEALGSGHLLLRRPAGRDEGLHPLQAVVVEELVTRRREQLGRRIAHAYADDPAIQLAKLLDQRREVAVTSADHDRRHEVALKGQLECIDHHLDVSRVLAAGPHALGYLDQFDLMAGQVSTIVIEVRPVRIGPPVDDPATFSHGPGNRTEVEAGNAEVLAGADGKVLVVDEERYAFLVVVWSHPDSITGRGPRFAPAGQMAARRSPSACPATSSISTNGGRTVAHTGSS